jgi:hypothetical protein
MKIFTVGFLMVTAWSGCQTPVTPVVVEVAAPVTQSTIHCSIKLPSEKNAVLDVEAKVSSAPNSSAKIILVSKNRPNPDFVSSIVSPDGMILFNANPNEPLAIRVQPHRATGMTKTTAPQEEVASISKMSNGFDEGAAVACVSFLTSDENSIAKPATCNAQGTPAEGWYQNGRIIKLSGNCRHEILSCADGGQQGWYLQKKTQRVLAKLEKCSWVSEKPQCVAGAQATGWHLGDRLISRDDDCAFKHIECGATDTKKEGWYVFEHTKPKLLISGNCRTSREISYLGQ